MLLERQLQPDASDTSIGDQADADSRGTHRRPHFLPGIAAINRADAGTEECPKTEGYAGIGATPKVIHVRPARV